MNDLRHPVATAPATQGTASSFNWPRAFTSLAFSIVINAVCPYLIYRALEPHYPAPSLIPLLASTVFPLIGLVLGAVRQRMVDTIAIISLVEIAISIVVTLVASDIRLALIARALQGTLTGLFFMLTVPLNRPLIYYTARQFVAATSPQIAAGFEAAARRDNNATFKRLTLLWGLAIIFSSIANLALALTVSAAEYVLYAPIVGIGTNVLMIAWTIRTARKRFEK